MSLCSCPACSRTDTRPHQYEPATQRPFCPILPARRALLLVWPGATGPYKKAKDPVGLTQIIYTSQPFGFDESTLSNILLDARRCNNRDDITGALVCRRDIYMQFLEGPDTAVRATLARIAEDDRHVDLAVHLDMPATERIFAAWDMLHDPAHSWSWSEAEIANGALAQATSMDFLNIFTAIARKQAA